MRRWSRMPSGSARSLCRVASKWRCEREAASHKGRRKPTILLGSRDQDAYPRLRQTLEGPQMAPGECVIGMRPTQPPGQARRIPAPFRHSGDHPVAKTRAIAGAAPPIKLAPKRRSGWSSGANGLSIARSAPERGRRCHHRARIAGTRGRTGRAAARGCVSLPHVARARGRAIPRAQARSH
jgi:hypothetical protein